MFNKKEMIDIMATKFNSSFAVKTLVDIYLSEKYKIPLTMMPFRHELDEEKIKIRRSLSNFLGVLHKKGYIKKISKRYWKIIGNLEEVEEYE